MKNKYAIVDIETTGTFSNKGGITEIAIIVTDGENIIETYETLVNPQAEIPPFVVNLTGITNQMVQKAPLFGEIAEKVASILEGTIFVAHNVSFDYKYVKYELDLAGYRIGQARLCTVRLSRKILPGLPSYSLGKLTRTLGIAHNNKHRAMSDTMATTELFHLLLKKGKRDILKTLTDVAKSPNLPANLPERIYNKLPKDTGVYYFYNQKKEVIYIGKAKNIYQRITAHFTGKATAQKLAFYKEIAHVRYELTGTETIAALLEDAEIKYYWPIYNRSQKSRVNKFGVFVYENQLGIKQLGITKIGNQIQPIKTFPSMSETRRWLLQQIEKFDLKPKFCGMSEFDDETVSIEKHKQNIEAFLQQHNIGLNTFLLVGKGREEEEKSFIYFENGKYKGFGFVEEYFDFKKKEEIQKYIQLREETVTTRAILRAENRKDFFEIFVL